MGERSLNFAPGGGVTMINYDRFVFTIRRTVDLKQNGNGPCQDGR